MPWQIYDVFMMDAITYFIAAFLIFLIPYSPIKKINEYSTSIFQRLKIGFDYLKENKNVFIFGVGSYMVFAMLLVEIHAVLPTYIKQHLQAKGNVFALADTIYAVGALSAGFFINKLFKKTVILKAIIMLTFLTVGIFIAAFLSKSVLVIYVVSIILGFCNAGIRVLRLTYMFNIIPNKIMGRVGSIFNLINVLTRSVFIFIFSQKFFSSSNNIIYAYLIMGVFLFISGVALHKIRHNFDT
jgi:MFS family permease